MKDVRTIQGHFTEFDGTIEADEAIEDLRASGVIRAASVDTRQPQRDEHLRSPDFFDAASFPEIRFETRGVESREDGAFRILGALTIKEATFEVPLEASLRGPAQDPYGNDRIAIDARGRLEWGDMEVEIVADVSATKVG